MCFYEGIHSHLRYYNKNKFPVLLLHLLSFNFSLEHILNAISHYMVIQLKHTCTTIIKSIIIIVLLLLHQRIIPVEETGQIITYVCS